MNWRKIFWAAVLGMVSAAGGGCASETRSMGVSARLPRPVPTSLVEQAVRETPGVTPGRTRPQPPAYTLMFQRIPTPDVISFDQPDLPGAEGTVTQDVSDLRTSVVMVRMTWPHVPTPADRERAARVAEAVLANILRLVAGERPPGGMVRPAVP